MKSATLQEQLFLNFKRKTLNKSLHIVFMCIVTLISVMLLLIFLAGCSNNQQKVIREFSLGKDMPTVKLDADYQEAELTDELKKDDAIAYYTTDADAPNVVVYRFPWKKQGNFSSMNEYFEHEAKTYNSKIYDGTWEDAGFPECKAYTRTEDFLGEKYITTCYGIQDKDDCVEVFYLNKINETSIELTDAKFYVPEKIYSVELIDPERNDAMIEKRISSCEYFPSLFFYTWSIPKGASIKDNTDTVMNIVKKLLKTDNVVREDINGIPALRGRNKDNDSNEKEFYLIEWDKRNIMLSYDARNDENISHGQNIAKSIHK